MRNARPNGVSEMPDPEAAEYLSQHQSQDLGADVVNSARMHYNGTEHGEHKPASTDRHATIEERMNPVSVFTTHNDSGISSCASILGIHAWYQSLHRMIDSLVNA